MRKVNPIQWQVENEGWRVTSPYGQRTGKYAGFHRGVDLGGRACGYPVRTSFSGTVVAARTSGMGTWGNTVCIRLDPDGRYISLNAHLGRITVREGQRVKAGDQIGTNGGSNHSGASYDCHIHYEILNNNGSAPWRGSLWGDPQQFFLTQGDDDVSVDTDIKTIVICAGHGGRDPGAVANGVQEKDANLRVALACRDCLENEFEGHNIVMVREDDRLVSLPAQRDLVRRVSADFFVDIHFNSFRLASAHGFETFRFSGPVYSQTIRNQECIHDSVYSYLGGLGITDRGMKQSRHWTVSNVPCSVTLVEYMFLSNPREAEIAKSAVHCREMGYATARGIAKAQGLRGKAQRDSGSEEQDPEGIFRVIAGSYAKRENAMMQRNRLESMGIEGVFIDFVEK